MPVFHPVVCGFSVRVQDLSRLLLTLCSVVSVPHPDPRCLVYSVTGLVVNSFLTKLIRCVTFHESSTLVCQFRLLGQFIETSTMKSLPLVSVSKGFTSLL